MLESTRRDARVIRDGRLVEIPADRQHDPAQIHEIDFPGLGRLEAIPNGDGVHFTDLLGVTETIRETGRYSLRWPGWSTFWNPPADCRADAIVIKIEITPKTTIS